MKRLNVLWVIDHVCYDGSLHGGGRLYWNVLPQFDPELVRVTPCLLRATPIIRDVFAKSPTPVRILDKGKFDPTTLGALLRDQDENIHDASALLWRSTFGRLAGHLTGVPTLIHDYDTEVYFPYPTCLRFADRLLAPGTKQAIAASPMVREFLIRKRNIADNRIRTMLHAIPMAKFDPLPDDCARQVRSQLRVDSGAPLIGTITKLGPQRGNESLLQAARIVLENCRDARFVVIYQPTYFHRLPSLDYVPITASERESQIADLQRLAATLGVADAVRFVEWPDSVDAFIAACDLMVAPFQSARFSSVHLLEAMARGKPLIATDVGEQREFLRHGINGYLVPPGDAPALASRIVETLTQPGDLERLGRAARAAAKAYSVAAYAQTLETIYRDLAYGMPKQGVTG